MRAVWKRRTRRLSPALGLVLLMAAGCGDDERGTNIDVPAPGGAGSASSSGGSTSHAGNRSNQAGAAEGGATDGGMPGTDGGSAAGGSSGSSSGGGSMSGAGGTSSAGTSSAGTSSGGTSSGGTGGGGAGGTSSGGSGGAASGSGGSGGSGGSAGGSGAGGSSSGGVCGNGMKEAAEECDDMGPSRLCSDDCRTVSTVECVACEQAGDCAGFSDNCLGPDGSFTHEQVGLCYDVMRCIQDANCLDGAGTVGKCYCGTLTTAECSAASFDLKKSGSPNGPCAALMQKASPGVTSNSQMLSNLFTKTRPGGAAGQRLNCQKNADECRAICGLE